MSGVKMDNEPVEKIKLHKKYEVLRWHIELNVLEEAQSELLELFEKAYYEGSSAKEVIQDGGKIAEVAVLYLEALQNSDRSSKFFDGEDNPSDASDLGLLEVEREEDFWYCRTAKQINWHLINEFKIHKEWGVGVEGLYQKEKLC